ncbi:thioredoxin family protein [Aeromicrobium sp. Root472D3]|uniref:thioredoxin family protein n=1 Tax=Aeromicrobium sp. Root472D3 TaxID=1736540 RepID=UPI0006F37EC3|nr:thioredoxin family protein [Aeromicrobium sp. Root472D3]KQX71700.1 thioredoxin [Aeromicrobium sp. Root472D3]
MIGLVLLGIALVATAGVALLMRWKNGRFSSQPVEDARERLTAGQIGAPLGERATLVQFSSAFCSPCRATRVLLTDIAATAPGVETVEIDAESHLQLVRDLEVMRTPTVLVLDADGVVTTRASGLPRRDQVLAALDRAVPGGK